MADEKQLYTTLGQKKINDLKCILSHEHLFVEFRTPDKPGHAQADVNDVVRLMAPEVEAMKRCGISAMVDCTPVGVGRRADIVKAVSDATDFPLVVPTGVYMEPWIPEWIHQADETELEQWMTGELTESIGTTPELQEKIEISGLKAGWIKLAAGDNGLTDCEIKVLRAASLSGRKTGAVIGSHTMNGTVVRNQIDIIEKMGYNPERFIWIHAQTVDDFSIHREMASRGAWIEYDFIGMSSEADETHIELILRMLDAGYVQQILIGQDAGWYDPAKPGGGEPRPYTHIVQEFLPKLKASGIDEKIISMLMRDNPFRAFAR